MTERPIPERPRKRVVVIGGGIAGISAAEGLALAREATTHGDTGSTPEGDTEIVLLEARRRLGGRAGSFTDPSEDTEVDYCQHVGMGCCTNLLAMMRRAGASDAWRRDEALTFYHPESGFSRFRPSRWLPAPLHLASALWGLRFLTFSEKLSILSAMRRLLATPESDLIDVIAADWLRANGQTVRVCERFWNVILVSALGDMPHHVSMAASRKVFADGFAGARGASDLLVPVEPLSQIFSVRMRDRLASLGVQVHTNSPVHHAVRTGPRTFAIEHGAASGPVACDAVVLATRSRTTDRLLKELGAEKICAVPSGNAPSRTLAPDEPEVVSSPITGMHLWFDRRLTDRPHVAMVGTLAHWLFCEPLRTRADDHSGVYHQVVISGKHPLSDQPKEVWLQTVLDELRHAFPETSEAKLVRHRIVTDPNSVFRVSPDFMRTRPITSTDGSGIALAGDWIDTGWPATMEGAVISGAMAAQEISQTLGLPSGTRVEHPLHRGWLARRLVAP
ncbi:MAG: hydroxysqualene dehydroxylase HpnE [Planctomycetota bacterium]